MISKRGIFSYRKISWIIIFALPLLSFFTLYKMIRQTPFTPQSFNPHPITQFVKENSELRSSVMTQNRIGYIDEKLKATVVSNATARYYLFQYLLAPTVVVHSTEPEYLLSYQGDKTAQKLVKEKKAIITRGFKNGVLLLKRTTST